MSNLTLAIEVLEKELERTTLLIKSSEEEKQLRDDCPEWRVAYPAIEKIYPQIHQLRDELESAIAILKTQNNGE